MSGQPQPRRGRTLLRAIAGALVLAAFIGAAWFLRSAAFREWVRGRVVARLEAATGGRVEMRDFHWRLAQLHFTAAAVTIHGLEGPGQAPYFHADRIVFDAKVLSLVRQEIGLRSLEVDRPVLHIITYPDGRTNQPAPRAALSGKDLERLFALEVDKAEIRGGVLLFNDRAIPLDVSADDVSAAMTYVPAARRYDGTLNVARLRTAYRDFGPVDAAAAAEFSLADNRLEMKSLRLSSGQLQLEAAGQVVDFASPRAEFRYHGSLNLPEAAAAARLPQIRRGTAQVEGSGTYAAGDYRTAGKVALRDVEYRDQNVRVAALNGGAEFTADKTTLSLPHLFGSIFSGTISGSAEIRNWRGEQQEGALRLRAANIPVSALAGAIPRQSAAVAALRPAGTVSGPLEMTWRGSPARASTAFSLVVTPPARIAPGEMPLAGTMRGEYFPAGGRLRLQDFNLTAGSAHITATGALAVRAQLAITLNIGNLRDLYALLQAANVPLALPHGLEGGGTFTGTVGGRLSAPEIAGHVALANLTAPRPLLALGPARNAGVAHFDSFTADVRYSPSQAAITHALLRRGGEEANFSVTATLDHGRLHDTGAITASGRVRNFSLAEAQALLGFEYPLTGVLDATAQLGGTRGEPRGSGTLAITRATLYGEPVQSANADFVVAGHEMQAGNIVIAHNGARVTGSAAYDVRSTAFRFAITGSSFDLAQVRQLQTPRLALGGVLSFTARGSGTREAPVIDADMRVRNLLMNGEAAGDLEATAATSGGVMRVSGRSSSGSLRFDGAIAMHDRFPANFKLTLDRLDADPLLNLALRGHLAGRSSLAGVVTISGPLRTPRLLTLRGDISEFEASVKQLRIRNDGPLRFSVENEVLTLDQFRLAGEDTRLGATGEIQLTGNRTLNVRADGHVQLKLLETFNSDLHASGTADFAVAARGTLSRPALVGRATLANGAVTHINFPNGLSNMNGTLLFNQDRMQIQSLSATSGGGKLTFSGFVTYGNGVAFNVTAAAAGVRLRYPQGMSSTVDGNLHLTGSPAGATLGGAVSLLRFNLSPDFDIATVMVRARNTPDVANPSSALNKLRLDLRVTSNPDLQVSTTMAKLSGDVDLAVRGTTARPVLLGRINVTEGQVTFNGATYQIDRGDIAFSSPVRIEPVVDMEMTTRVRDYDITLGFHGPVDHMSMTYRSDPPVPTTDIISLLAFGTTREEAAMTTGPNPTFTESASSAILGQALSEAQNSRVQRLFGASRVKIAPETTGAETNPNARVTIEQQVSNNFTITYITDLTHSASQQQIVQVEYNYSRNLSIVGSRDQYGIVSFDVRIRQRKK
jgi:translocation and assembly module TamB